MAKDNKKNAKNDNAKGAKAAAPAAAGAMDYTAYEGKMKKTIEVLGQEFGAIRAGQANASVLDRINVDYYGQATPIGQVASISAPEPRTLMIQPWDASLLKAIEKSLLTSDLGINPQNDGRVIRLIFPQLTEERRKELAKQVSKLGEDAKVAIRNVRREAVDAFKAKKKKSEITEDDLSAAEKDIQNLTDKYIKEVEGVVSNKEKELLSV